VYLPCCPSPQIFHATRRIIRQAGYSSVYGIEITCASYVRVLRDLSFSCPCLSYDMLCRRLWDHFLLPGDGGSNILRYVGTNLESSTAGYLRDLNAPVLSQQIKVLFHAPLRSTSLIFLLFMEVFNKEILSFSKFHQKLNINFFLNVHVSNKNIV